MSSPTWISNLKEQCAELGIKVNMKEIEEMKRSMGATCQNSTVTGGRPNSR